MAGLKYLFYSFCGAYMALFGIYFLYKHTTTLDFVAGGSLDLGSFGDGTEFKIFLVAVFLMIIGFGVKAGSFPLHAWLPTAHPVAPAPASAFLSGIIVKGGVLAIIRSVYYVVGADNIRGTWVQYTWIILAVITIVMGSSLAFKERILKKRFAYSTVSNLSYILLGLAMLNETAYTGAMLHVVFHAFIKSALFMVAGALIFTTGKNKVNDFVGLGRKMPILFTAYIVVSLGLIGIPPTSGVVSKWYLAIGSLNSGTGVLAWIGPVALLVSALLTAGYLLPIAIRGFLKSPEDEMMLEQYREPSFLMVAPIVLMAVVTLVLGLYPTPLINFIMSIAGVIL
jgi:multicomponent Na+:H+ antiporter subunit D